MFNKSAISLEEIISYMPGHVYWKDINGVYLGCNLSLAQVLGLKNPQEIVGVTAYDLTDESNASLVDAIDTEVMLNNKVMVLEEEGLDSEGNCAVYFTKKQPLHDSSGRVIGMLGVSLDITKRKFAEKKAQEAQEAAEASNRAKTEFLANMSHDMKTPLTGVVGMADLMAHDSEAREVDRERAESIYACGLQAVSLFDSCLSLSKMEMQEWATKTEMFSLRKLLNDIHALMAPKAKTQQLSLTLEYDDTLPTAVEGHRESLYRVLLNLVSNALKFTEKGGVVLRALWINTTDEGRVNVEFQVQDTGIGIPADKHHVIFEKLQRLTPSYEGKVEGSGIGLYIVDQYVKRMGGSIQVTSRINAGSTFTVTLPLKITSEQVSWLSATVSPTSQEVLCPIASPTSFKATTIMEPELFPSAPYILLVEDNPLVQLVTKSLLTEGGFQVDIASNGAEALQLFAPEKYHLIYMDIGLPDMDGYTVTRAMRELEQKAASASTPIIALTGHGAIDVQQFCGDAGMQGVLSKPLSRDQAQKIWQRYGEPQAIEVPGLILLKTF